MSRPLASSAAILILAAVLSCGGDPPEARSPDARAGKGGAHSTSANGESGVVLNGVPDTPNAPADTPINGATSGSMHTTSSAGGMRPAGMSAFSTSESSGTGPVPPPDGPGR